MAIACLRLRTGAPDPLLSVPDLRRRIAEATVFDAADFLFAIAASVAPLNVMRMQAMFRAESVC